MKVVTPWGHLSDCSVYCGSFGLSLKIEVVPLVEFTYLVFTHVPVSTGNSGLLLCPLSATINPLCCLSVKLLGNHSG